MPRPPQKRKTIMPRLPRQRRPRTMPRNFQIYLLKKLFTKANADRGDLWDEMDNIEWGDVDGKWSYEENLGMLEQNYPQYNWRIFKPETPKATWEQAVNERTGSVVYKGTFVVKPHTVKVGKKRYVLGRIQVSVDKSWIGRKARIFIRIPEDAVEAKIS